MGIAEELAARQREISISEFFEKNKHLLGFDNPAKALLIVVKEAVDNSIDACMEAGILPTIKVKIKGIGEERYRVEVEDNGPGLPPSVVPKTFGKFLYGSRFHRLCQARGQQGIGIKGCVLYAQLTTAKPAQIWSKTGEMDYTYFVELKIDVTRNEPVILKEERIPLGEKGGLKEHGIRIGLEVIGRYRRSKGVDEYLLETAIANPFVRIEYEAPDGRKEVIERATDHLPKLPKEIKPHPYGIELGIFLRMLKASRSRTLEGFLVNEFCRIGTTTARKACKLAKLDGTINPHDLTQKDAERLLKVLQGMPIQRPPLDCLSPIGSKDLEAGLRKLFPNAEFIAAYTREPNVYRGNPFQVEAAVVYDPTRFGQADPVRLIRFANRAPLLYQQSACAIYKAVTSIDWRRYGLNQAKGSLPIGPCLIAVHLCSVWVPFISEGKEAIASYPIILKEIRLALQQVGRKLSAYLSGKRRAHLELQRRELFQRYAGEVSKALSSLAEEPEADVKRLILGLIEKRRKTQSVKIE